MDSAEAMKKTKCLIKMANCDVKLIQAAKVMKCVLTASLIAKTIAAVVITCKTVKDELPY